MADCDPTAFTLATAPARFAERGDASAGIDSAAGSLDALLELSASQAAAGLGDAPWPPHYKKQRDVAAIFAAVIADGPLMTREEVAAFPAEACRAIIDGLIASHRGRVVNTARDSVVADFASAV